MQLCIVMGKITQEDRLVIKALRVQKNCVLNVYYDKICLKFALHHFLLYVLHVPKIIEFYLCIQMLPSKM